MFHKFAVFYFILCGRFDILQPDYDSLISFILAILSLLFLTELFSPMFNCLEIHAGTKSMLRCKKCKSILFGQDQITEFMAYDPNDFGKLQGYAHYKKYEEQADFFLLNPAYDTYSSFKIDYGKSLRLDYHPFFMMHMLLIECAKCGNNLGYQVETVNENTIWMDGRTLIDSSKCSIMKDGKDEMQKIIKTCRLRLANKLESVNLQQKPQQKNLKEKIYKKLEKIKLPNQKIPKILNAQKEQQVKDKVSQDLKRRGVSVQSTKGQTSFMYKDQKQSMSNYTLNDFTFKTDELSYFRQFEDKTFRQNQMTESMVSISMEKMQRNVKHAENPDQEQTQLKDYFPIEMSQQKREKLSMSLQLWREKTINQSKNLLAHPIIEKIEEHMWKLDAYERLMMSKIIDQQLKMEKMYTIVRENVLGETRIGEG